MSSARTSPVRLRSTCDACSVAKVKCDKKQPLCDRCRTNCFTCSYSTSRRHGKKPWAKKVAEQQSLNSAIPNPPKATPLLALPLLGSTNNDCSGFGQPGLPDQMVDANGRDGQDADYAMLIDFDMLGDEPDFLSQWTGVDSGVYLPNGSEGLETQVHYTGPNRILNGEMSNPMTSPGDSTSASEPPQPPIHDCEAKAFTTLHSLHYCTMHHTDLPGVPKRESLGNISNRMPPLDKVLFFNRVAMGTLKELLDCPCALQPHLTLLYMTIVSKALFWYRLAV